MRFPSVSFRLLVTSTEAFAFSNKLSSMRRIPSSLIVVVVCSLSILPSSPITNTVSAARSYPVGARFSCNVYFTPAFRPLISCGTVSDIQFLTTIPFSSRIWISAPSSTLLVSLISTLLILTEVGSSTYLFMYSAVSS